MFYFLIVLSILGYSLQGTLIVAFSRRVDALSLAVYRNISLVITMPPLLLFSSTREIAAIPDYLPWIGLTGISGTIGVVVMFHSVRFLPVGISSGLRQSSGVLFSILLGLVFFNEVISVFQLLAIIVILIGVAVISTSHNPMPHLITNVMLGSILSLGSGIFIAIAFFMMGKLAREVGPAVSGYVMEASIGVCSLLFIVIRKSLTGKRMDPVSLRTFFKIALVSSPTLIGTGAAAWAITLGPFGIMRAYNAAGVLVTILISHLIYSERLRISQWIGIFITIAGTIALRLG